MELLLRAGAAYLFQDQFKRLNDHIEDNIRSPDKRRPIGSKSTLNGKPVYWSGENYGWQSEGSYNKLKEGPEFRAGHIAASRIGTDINQAISTGFNALPEPVKQTTKDVAKKAVDTYQSLPDPVKQGVSSATDFIGDVNEGISKATNISPIITEEVAQTALTFGAGKIAFAGGKAAVKYDIPSRIYEAQRDIRGMSAVPLGTPGSVGAASAMKPANWSQAVRALKGDTIAIQNLLSKPYHEALKGTRFEYMTLEDLSKDTGGWLTTLSKRDEKFSVDHAAYMRNPSSVNQRKMYDGYSDNPLSDAKQVYDNNLLRKAITSAFNEVTGKEWHHIFGNKEAAEAMLTTVTQDPYIAVNLFHHLKRLKLPVSGTADNIALIDIADHRKRGGLHSYQKQLGIENKGSKKGVLELNDMAKSISEAVLKGETDITEIFTLLEAYAKLNQQHLRPLIKNQYGGKVLSELKGMEAFIQGQ